MPAPARSAATVEFPGRKSVVNFAGISDPAAVRAANRAARAAPRGRPASHHAARHSTMHARWRENFLRATSRVFVAGTAASRAGRHAPRCRVLDNPRDLGRMTPHRRLAGRCRGDTGSSRAHRDSFAGASVDERCRPAAIGQKCGTRASPSCPPDRLEYIGGGDWRDRQSAIVGSRPGCPPGVERSDERDCGGVVSVAR